MSARMWSGVLLAPVAWLLAEGVGYVVASRTCEGTVETGHARIADIVICVACLIIAALGLVVAIGNARIATQNAERGPTLLSFGGAFSSALFTAGIVLFALPATVVNACNQVR